MTTQNELANIRPNASGWQKVRAWLTAIDEAIAYDPNEQADETIRQLRKSVKQLETKVAELQGCNPGEISPVITEAVSVVSRS